jgi:hypothetical protein
VVVIVYDHKSSGPLDEHFISEFERGMESSGAGKRVSGKFIEIRGIKSYERLGNAVVDGKCATVLTQVIPVKGRIYLLQGLRVEGEANDDPEILSFLASFSFIMPPVAQPEHLAPESIAFRIGFWAASTLVIFAIIVNRRAVAARKSQSPKA